MIKYIPLTKGLKAAVDSEDYLMLIQRKWYAVKSGSGYRAYSDSPFRVSMHGLIMNLQKGFEVDHIDGNGLNNCKYNLRICVHSQNLQNQRKQTGTSSRFKGVSWNKNVKKWHAYIKSKGIRYNLGFYDKEEDAALAYNIFAVGLFGEFAKVNEI
jgi:hypothetical protein